jgi:hypothetical protein
MEHPFIKSVAKIAYAEDSSRAIVTFTTDNGVVTYQFSIFDLQTIVGANLKWSYLLKVKHNPWATIS